MYTTVNVRINTAMEKYIILNRNRFFSLSEKVFINNENKKSRENDQI